MGSFASGAGDRSDLHSLTQYTDGSAALGRVTSWLRGLQSARTRLAVAQCVVLLKSGSYRQTRICPGTRLVIGVQGSVNLAGILSGSSCLYSHALSHIIVTMSKPSLLITGLPWDHPAVKAIADPQQIKVMLEKTVTDLQEAGYTDFTPVWSV